jgi:hypothetical protein
MYQRINPRMQASTSFFSVAVCRFQLRKGIVVLYLVIVAGCLSLPQNLERHLLTAQHPPLLQPMVIPGNIVALALTLHPILTIIPLKTWGHIFLDGAWNH